MGPPRFSLKEYVTTPPAGVSCTSFTASEQPKKAKAVRIVAHRLVRQCESIASHDLLPFGSFHKLEKLLRCRLIG